MFDFVRNHQRGIQIALAIFIIPSFLFFGLEGFLRDATQGADTVAKVGGQNISKDELDRAMQNYLREAANQGQKVEETPQLRYAVLSQLVDVSTVAQEVTVSGLKVSNELLQGTILQFPNVKNEKGEFEYDRYMAALVGQNSTPLLFEERLRKDIASNYLMSGVQAGSWVSKEHMKQIAQLLGQERVVKEKTFNYADYLSKVKITPEKIKEYYDKNDKEFSTAAEIDAEYLVLRKKDLAAKVAVTNEQIEADYNKNKVEYLTGDSQRNARHVLIKFPDTELGKTPSDKNLAAARKKAEEVRALLLKKGVKFADIAKKYSEDEGSAKVGGDLGWFGRKMMTQNFEEAAFTQKQNEIGSLVQTEFGFHIVEVLGAKEPVTATLDEVRSKIDAKLRDAEVGKTFSTKVDTFSNLIYEQSGSLAEAAKAMGLTVQTAKGITFENAPVPELNSPKILTTLFGSDSIQNKRNVDAVEVEPDVWVSARVVAHRPSVKKSLQEVTATVTQNLSRQDAQALAEADAKRLVDDLNAGKSTESMIEKAYSRNQEQPSLVSSVVMQSVVTSDGKDGVKAAPQSVNDANGVTVFQVVALRLPAQTDEKKLEKNVAYLTNVYRNAPIDGVRRFWRDAHQAKLYMDKPNK